MKLLNIFIFSLFITYGVNADIVKNSTNTLKDTKTGYIWQDTKEAASKKRTFDEAISYCKKLKLDGIDSWELPGFVEMFSIVDTKAYNPCISKKFKNIVPKDYWISKRFANGTSNEAFVVNFVSGAFNREKMDKAFYVRCYRK